MWREEGAHYYLQEHENILKKWLPVLSIKDSFTFIEDIEVEWVHDWPNAAYDNCDIIYFIRDPRDSFYSRYKRENPDLSFQSFVNFIDPQTLLNKIDNWAYFNRCWMAKHRVKPFRFEDYKADPYELLSQIIRYMGLSFNAQELADAIKVSTQEMAASAEAKYRHENPDDKEIINRGGIVNNWTKLSGNDRQVIDQIESRSVDVLQKLNYVSNAYICEPYYEPVPNARCLSFLGNLDIDCVFNSHEYVSELNRFHSDIMKLIDSTDLKNELDTLRNYEKKWLVDSLSEYVIKYYISDNNSSDTGHINRMIAGYSNMLRDHYNVQFD